MELRLDREVALAIHAAGVIRRDIEHTQDERAGFDPFDDYASSPVGPRRGTSARGSIRAEYAQRSRVDVAGAHHQLFY